MEYFLFADIHANQDALTACLIDYVLEFEPSAKTRDKIIRALQKQNISTEAIDAGETGSGIERIIFLGDQIGYGVEPDSCVGITFDLADEMVLGNHEVSVCDRAHPINDSVQSKELFLQWEWTRKQLSPENFASLMGLYRQQRYMASEGQLIFSHGLPLPRKDFFYYSRPKDLWEIFSDQEFKRKICFSGHTHRPMALGVIIDPKIEPDRSVSPILDRSSRAWDPTESTFSLAGLENVFVSIPSVGQARDSCPLAGYAVYDSTAKELTFRRVSYDIEATAARIDARDLEIFGKEVKYYGDRLKKGK
ncbi:MAG TPA: metallophosphoesterase family protein [Candidatus Nanoarchaeia archaeon]|nr:metallophosphoesterase family protein [Candidatus Nanoarchaeia archaeon]